MKQLAESHVSITCYARIVRERQRPIREEGNNSLMAFLSYKETQCAMSANSDNTGSRTHNSPSKASIRVCCTLKSYLARTRQLSPASDVVY